MGLLATPLSFKPHPLWLSDALTLSLSSDIVAIQQADFGCVQTPHVDITVATRDQFCVLQLHLQHGKLNATQ